MVKRTQRTRNDRSSSTPEGKFAPAERPSESREGARTLNMRGGGPQSAVLGMTARASSLPRARASVLVCFDEGYARAAAVMLTSLLENNGGVPFDLYALVDDVSSSSRDTLASLCARFDRSLRWLTVAPRFARQFARAGHISRAAYLRIAGPELVDAERVIYLDVDLIVQTGLQPLLEADFDGKLLLAARDNNPNPGTRSRLGLPWDAAYVNTGVMVIDAETWRAEGITADLSHFYQRHGGDFEWADQDLINAALHERIGLLERRWNVLYGDIVWGGHDYPDFEFEKFQGIFHYNSARKPWNSGCDARYAALYEAYAARAPMRMPKTTPSPARRLRKKLQRRLARQRIRWRHKLTEDLRLQRVVGLLHGPPTARTDFPEPEFSIHTITCHRDVEMTLWSLKSFTWSSGLSPRVFVHDDGSLTRADASKLRRHIHRLTLIERADADARVDRWLERYPHARRARAVPDFYCALKLLDPWVYTPYDVVLLLDSDVLFFRKPEALLEHGARGTPCFNSDYQNAYAAPCPELAARLGFPIEPAINAGLVVLPRASFDMDLVERYFATSQCPPSNRDEQTLYAAMLSRARAERLAPEYQISMRSLRPVTRTHHFTSDGARPRFWTEGVPRLARIRWGASR